MFLWWEQAGFDADQAIFGLMAKHLADLAAFPMFIYGAHYMLAVQAWLAAPLFAVAGPSVAALKVPVVLVNVATGSLLVWVLHRDGGLRPWLALLASLFFVAAPPSMAASLVETGGGNPEPFLYVLLLWVLRGRPLWFGVVFGLGFVQREFTAYGLTAVAAIALAQLPRLTADRWRAIALMAVGYAAVWQLVRIGFLFSAPMGPGSTMETPLGAASNVGGLFDRGCWSPSAIVPGLAHLFGDALGMAFGGDNHRLSAYGIRSTLRTTLPGMPGLWPLLGVVLAAALGRVAWLGVRRRQAPWRGHGAVGLFLLLVGLQAAVAAVVARCGVLEVGVFRYALLSLYLGVGIVHLFFVYERQRTWQVALGAAVVAWAVASSAGHARLAHEYIHDEPASPHRDLATYLVTNGIRYGRADYWTAYATTFLSNERVRLASTDFVRIAAYQEQEAAHRSESVHVRREPCPTQGGTEAVPGTFWVCLD